MKYKITTCFFNMEGRTVETDFGVYGFCSEKAAQKYMDKNSWFKSVNTKSLELGQGYYFFIRPLFHPSVVAHEIQDYDKDVEK